MTDQYEDNLDKELSKDLDDIDVLKSKFDKIEDQVKAEYTIAYDDQSAKRAEWANRLKLYNNQRRDKSAAGDTTMFSIMQTVLATLYSDQLQVQFNGRVSGDEEVANALNVMYQFDYEDMEKDESDYDWDWDTLFFGRGLCLLHDFYRDPEKKIFLPVPEVIDPLTFIRDPHATSVNGNRFGKGAARFFGRGIRLSREEIEDRKKHPYFFKNIDFKNISVGSETRSLLNDASDQRSQAQNREGKAERLEENLGANALYDAVEWWTRWKIDGKVEKVRLWLVNERQTLIGAQVLTCDKWPLIDRPLYPTSHDWDGTSIPDLTEDKQRHRAVIQNLGMNLLKADLMPMYLYDKLKIKSRSQMSFALNKGVPVEGDPNNAVVPFHKASNNMALLDFIYTSLDVSAQKATATPEIQQGTMSAQDRTLGELNIVKSQADTRYALSAKIFGRSEKRFALQWYSLYKDNFEDDIDEKLVRLTSAYGAKWKGFTKENMIGEVDPDVSVESKVLSRIKRMEDLELLSQYFNAVLTQDPTANMKWAHKKLGELFGLEKDEIDRFLPQTVDEREAERENIILNEDKEDVPVLPEQNHQVHLEVHAKAADTKALFRHKAAHEIALELMVSNPDLFPVQQRQKEKAMMAQANGSQPTPMPQPGNTQQSMQTPDRNAASMNRQMQGGLNGQ